MHSGSSPAYNHDSLSQGLRSALAALPNGAVCALAITDLAMASCSESGLTRFRAQLRADEQLFDDEMPRLAFLLQDVASEAEGLARLEQLFERANLQWLASVVVLASSALDVREWLTQADRALSPDGSAYSAGALQAQGFAMDPPVSDQAAPGLSDRPARLPADVMETILDNIDAYVFIKDSRRLYRYANLPLEGLYGFQRDEILGKDDSAFHSGESLQALWRNDEAVLRSDRALVAEEQVFDHDGNEGWYLSRKMPIDLPNIGRCLLGMATDITQSKLAIAGLVRSELKFRSLFEASLDSVGVIDAQGAIREINDAALTMFGCADRDYFLTLKPADLSPAFQPDGRSSAEAAAEQIACAMEHGRHEFEWLHHRLDSGEEFLALVSMNRIEIDGSPAILTRERDISAERAYERKLRRLAYTDSLTGLANEQAAEEWLSERMASCTDAAILVLGFDLDDFHRFNQVYGRVAGNELLMAFANALSATLAGEYVAARLQADEFLVVLRLEPDFSDESVLREHADRVVLHLRSALSAYLRHEVQIAHVPSFSIGASGWLPHRPPVEPPALQQAVDDLLLQVNAALRHASRRGVGQYEFFRPSMLSSSQQEIKIESELTAAIASGRLCLHYQPIVARDGSIVAAEALMRYRLEDGGLVYPGQFIQVAEKRGFINPLGQQLVETACG